MLTLGSQILRGAALAGALLGLSASTSLRPLDPEQLEGRAPTAEELRPSVEAAFPRESYSRGAKASLVFFNSAREVRLQLFRAGPERAPTVGNSNMEGVPVSKPVQIGGVRKGRAVSIHIGQWPSGLYFARVQAASGLLGFAPFVLRPK